MRFAAVLFSIATVTGLVRSLPSHLERRSPETIYLVNCATSDLHGAVDYSQVDYYNAGHYPQGTTDSSDYPDDVCSMDGSSWHVWEGGSQTCTFGSGTKFTWSIEQDAQSKEDLAVVGSGSNGYHKFSIHKEAAYRMIYQGTGGSVHISCRSVYYAVPQ